MQAPVTRSTPRLVPLASALWLVSVLFLSASAPPDRTNEPHRPATHAALSLFSHSENCQACHNGLASASGEDVSIGTMWRGSMMANSARDPYWQAAVRREVIDHPQRSADIQDECAACHMPMSRRVSTSSGSKGSVFAHLPVSVDARRPLDRLAADGVSCTVCHQIAADTLGTPASYNANFVMAPTPADGARVIFGPYRIDAGRKTIMRSATGFVQAEAPHIRQSELCASCHTLITEALDEHGNVIGSLPEQVNYQEWLHSAFPDESRGCQTCHMPAAEGPVRIAAVLGDRRDTLARHVFVGGNAFVVRLLDRYRDALGVSAPSSDLAATADAATRLLQQETATVALSPPEVSGQRLVFSVDVRNRTGHKFPTGFPSRRAWLHVTVSDEQGTRVFESGALDPAGAIIGNDNDGDPLAFEPHHDEITREDQVQVYESIPGDPAGRPTTGLLTATRYLKDNRLLPRGFDKTTASEEVAVHGHAALDADFTESGDRTRYAVPVAQGRTYRVDVELRYQPIGYRWAHNLERYDAAETNRFVSYYSENAGSTSVVVATARATVGPRSGRIAP